MKARPETSESSDLHESFPVGDGTDDWPGRRAELSTGLFTHLTVFVGVIVLLFMINWITRGDDGSWWVVYPLEIWAAAWGLHLFGVGALFAAPGGHILDGHLVAGGGRHRHEAGQVSGDPVEIG
ncbi:MAG: 2TM domain-containing protein [Acidimicrobiia bacterium]|nr:2TM domain-containing protein [Acidimicrobiia bacterium]